MESIGDILGRIGIAPTRAPGIVHSWPRNQAHIPFGTVMRRPDNPDRDGPPYQHGMALGNSGVVMLDVDCVGIISYTSGWEVDPDAEDAT